MKSDVSDLLRLALLVYDDACARCAADVSDLRDKNTIMSRVEKEGVSFLTITLPSFAVDFELSLEQGRIDPSSQFLAFAKRHRKRGPIPAFLQGMVGLLFDRETGRRLNEDEPPNPEDSVIVDSVRQICRAFNKLSLECTSSRTYKAIQGFVQTERDLDEFRCPDELLSIFDSVSHLLWTFDWTDGGYNPQSSDFKSWFLGRQKSSRILDFNPYELIPRHGPGQTADRITGNQKYVWLSWYERLEPYFPFLGNGYSVSAAFSKGFERVSFIPSCQELPVKVTPVPKTQKGPRIIAIEPACMQYTQQAVRGYLYDILERSLLSRGHVNFTDQTINQRMALIASRDRSLATIDLSEASDRVPLSLALRMFDGVPLLRDSIESCRSTHAILPDKTVIGPLLKFASMGSALCFPIESMYFYTVCILTLLLENNLSVTSENIYHVSRDVYVYGDDIIVPSTSAEAVTRNLQLFGCKINRNKTFISGFFRESCGTDAYGGYVVSPTYIRHLRPRNRRQATELISRCATANLFYKKGYWRTCSYLFNQIERILGDLPYISEDTPGLGRISFLGYRSIERWNRDLHRFEVRTMVPEAERRTDALSGYAALQKCLISLESRKRPDISSPFRDVIPEEVDPKHLRESPVYNGVTTLKRRWVPA